MPTPSQEQEQRARHEVVFGLLGILLVAVLAGIPFDIPFLPGGKLGLGLLLLALLRLALHAFWRRSRR